MRVCRRASFCSGGVVVSVGLAFCNSLDIAVASADASIFGVCVLYKYNARFCFLLFHG